MIGDCWVNAVHKDGGECSIIISRRNTPKYSISEYGYFNKNGECVIFPSKENRDWSTFCRFKPGDVVVVWDDHDNEWEDGGDGLGKQYAFVAIFMEYNGKKFKVTGYVNEDMVEGAYYDNCELYDPQKHSRHLNKKL